VRKVVIIGVTVAILVGYAHALSWAWDAGHWWAFPLGIGFTIWLCLKLSTPEEKAGYRRFWSNLFRPRQQTDDRP
jgi:hypothetical protein